MRRTLTAEVDGDDGRRAQSEVLGWTILLGLTMTAIGMILTFGMPILEGTQEDVRVQNIVNSMSLLDERVSAATLGGSERKMVEMNLQEGDMRVNGTAGRVNITIHDEGDPIGPLQRRIYSTENVGSIEYEIGSQIVGYQGGGIFVKDEQSNLSSFRSVPEIKYDGQTLTVSLVNITSTFSTAGSSRMLSLENAGSEQIHPLTDRSENPVNGTIRIVVTSEFYEGWARYFEEKTVGKKSVCVKTPSNETTGPVCDVSDDVVPRGSAVMKLLPSPAVPFQNAVLSTGGRVIVEGDSLVDSYNSDVADYSPATRLENADIVANKSVEMDCGGGPASGKVRWLGNVESEEGVEVCDATQVNGSIRAEGPPGGGPGPSSTIEISNNSHCPIRPSQDKLVAPSGRTIQRGDCSSSTIKRANPEIDTSAGNTIIRRIRDEVGDHCKAPDRAPHPPTTGTEINVTPGTYCINSSFPDSDWTGDTINFETKNGPIDVVINNGSSSNQMRVQDAKWNVTGENALRFWVGCSSSNNAWRIEDTTIKTVSNFTGVIQVYAAPTTGVSGCGTGPKVSMSNSTYIGAFFAPRNDKIAVESNSDYFGAIVASQTTITSSDLHYDEALRRLQLDAAGDQDRINYLYVTDNRVGID